MDYWLSLGKQFVRQNDQNVAVVYFETRALGIRHKVLLANLSRHMRQIMKYNITVVLYYSLMKKKLIETS